MTQRVWVIERLTVLTWGLTVVPEILRSRGHGTTCYVFEAPPLAFYFARITGRLLGVRVERPKFRLLDVRDDEELLVRFRIMYQDLADVVANVMADPAFQLFAQANPGNGRRALYIAKSVASNSFSERGTLWRALLLVLICDWIRRHQFGGSADAVLFLQRRLWSSGILQYASKYGFRIVFTQFDLNLRLSLKEWAGVRRLALLRTLRYRPLSLFGWPRPGSGQVKLKTQPNVLGDCLIRSGQPGSPRVAVEYYGQFNLVNPELHSDLFFWQQGPLKGNEIVVIFGLTASPLDEGKWRDLKKFGIGVVAVHPGATTLPDVPIFTHRWQHPSGGGGSKLTWLGHNPERRWLLNRTSDYQLWREYWADLFATHRVKVYVTWYKFDERHCAIADALEAVGGVSAVYQRSYEPLPSIDCAAASDVAFCFSQRAAASMQRSGSTVRYYVITGYLGDHRFRLVRRSARMIRDRLLRGGARYILAYFDENSHDERWWNLGHTLTRKSYAFLLERVLCDREVGLIVKPKAPSTLRRRLGPVAELLDRAEATGRCYMFKEGEMHGAYPPAAAALASDVAIHGHLCSGTAGIEAALAGVPTLLMDREGWPVSPLYRLGVGRVVFTNWQELWDAALQYRAHPESLPGFGDWSPVLDELDPFRDGRAAERMGTYIKWLIDGFKAGLDRSTVLADAAERYGRQWGMDKIITTEGAGFRKKVAHSV